MNFVMCLAVCALFSLDSEHHLFNIIRKGQTVFFPDFLLCILVWHPGNNNVYHVYIIVKPLKTRSLHKASPDSHCPVRSNNRGSQSLVKGILILLHNRHLKYKLLTFNRIGLFQVQYLFKAIICSSVKKKSHNIPLLN